MIDDALMRLTPIDERIAELKDRLETFARRRRRASAIDGGALAGEHEACKLELQSLFSLQAEGCARLVNLTRELVTRRAELRLREDAAWWEAEIAGPIRESGIDGPNGQRLLTFLEERLGRGAVSLLAPDRESQEVAVAPVTGCPHGVGSP